MSGRERVQGDYQAIIHSAEVQVDSSYHLSKIGQTARLQGRVLKEAIDAYKIKKLSLSLIGKSKEFLESSKETFGVPVDYFPQNGIYDCGVTGSVYEKLASEQCEMLGNIDMLLGFDPENPSCGVNGETGCTKPELQIRKAEAWLKEDAEMTWRRLQLEGESAKKFKSYLEKALQEIDFELTSALKELLDLNK